MKRLVSSIFCSLCLMAGARAGLGPENVALVINGDSANSLQIAHAYIGLRGVPSCNCIVLHHLSSIDFMDVDHFRSEILGPVLQAINERGLEPQIDCITYSADIPYSINVGSDIHGRQLPQVLTQPASINGLTYLTELTLKKDIGYLQLTANQYARRLLPIPVGKELTPDEQSAYAGGIAAYDKKDYKKAVEVLSGLMNTPRTDPNIPYNLACCQALLGDTDEALLSLRKAIGIGWRNSGQTATDPDLASLRTSDEFNKLLRMMELATVEIQPGAAFSHASGWNHAGGLDVNGAHYLLSTSLGVTVGRGNSVDEVIESLQRSSEADFTSPRGTIYFERNGDVRARTREWGFQAAAEELKKLGVNAIVEEGQIPQNRSDVAGAMIGISDFNWTASHSTILPGAILEHLTSFGGMLNKDAGQTPCTEFIRNGASGSSGTVTEPYALQEKFPTPFIQVQYAKGFSLAESFFMSVSGPYQLLVLGDPLCQPWAKKATVSISGIKPHQAVTTMLIFKPTLTGASASTFELFVDGRRFKSGKPGSSFSISPAALGPGYHQLAVVASRADATGTPYRTQFDVTVPGHSVLLSGPGSAHADDSVTVNVASVGAARIELMGLGSVLGKVDGAKGTVTIPVSALGLGASKLYAVATFAVGGRAVKVSSAPLTIAVNH